MDMKEFKVAMKEVAVEAVESVVEEKVKPMIQAVEEKIPKAPAEEKKTEEKAEEKPAEEKATEEKADDKIDLSEQIGAAQQELLDELQSEAPDMKKIESLNVKIETLKGVAEGKDEEKDKPPTIEDLQKQIDELNKEKADGKRVTKSRADSGQDGGAALKEEDDGLPQRDARGCVKRQPAPARR